MTPLPTAPRRAVSTPQIIGTLVVAALSAASWFGWMGWDSRYQIDPVTQVVSGPYETWQVAGCALSLIAVFAGALAWGVRPWYGSTALVVAFTAAWTWTASQRDDSGLFLVGAVLVAAGLSLATAIGSWIARVIAAGAPDVG